MSGGLDNVRCSLDNVCGSPAEVCGGLGKIVYCEVYKNLTKAMKTIQWERQEIKYPIQEMLWERCAEVQTMRAKKKT